MIKELLKLANHLDAKGLTKEADYLDGIIGKVAKKDYPEGEYEEVGGRYPEGLSQSEKDEYDQGIVREMHQEGDTVVIRRFQRSDLIRVMSTAGYATNWNDYGNPDVRDAWERAVSSGGVKYDDGRAMDKDYWSYIDWYHQENKSNEKGFTEENNWAATGKWLSPEEVVVILNKISESQGVPKEVPLPTRPPPGDLRGQKRLRESQGIGN